MEMNLKKEYKKPEILIKKFVVTDIISSSGVGNYLYIGGNEYRY